MPVSIKSAKEIELMRTAGRILGKVHEELAQEIVPGMSTLDIDRICEELIRSYGCIPSFLNYEGFPASVCVSVNDEVVHGIPSGKRMLKEGDIVSLDTGVIYKGYQSDAARTIGVGRISQQAADLIERTKLCFLQACIMRRQAGGCSISQRRLGIVRIGMAMASSGIWLGMESGAICMNHLKFLISGSGFVECA